MAGTGEDKGSGSVVGGSELISHEPFWHGIPFAQVQSSLQSCLGDAVCGEERTEAILSRQPSLENKSVKQEWCAGYSLSFQVAPLAPSQKSR